VAVISVSDEGEFGLIARITSRLTTTDRVLLGPGDDAAVVSAPDGRVVATTDVLVDGRHFRRDWSSAHDVGRKAAAQNLADVVAMGAVPTALLVGLACPATLAADWVDGLADGLRDEAELVGAAVVGGDVVSADTLCISVTALGDLRGRPPLTRSAAQPGDVVVVVGRLGEAAAGLAMLRAGRTEHPLAEAHRRPTVAYSEALALADAGATSMVDVSDGLVADLGHVAVASGVRIELVARDLPLSQELADAAEELGVDPLSWVAGGGDDHAFAATLPAHLAADRPLIGRVLAPRDDAEPGVSFLDLTPPDVAGHEHFRS
jgi:thiamine-monophosphate kinase